MLKLKRSTQPSSQTFAEGNNRPDWRQAPRLGDNAGIAYIEIFYLSFQVGVNHVTDTSSYASDLFDKTII
jgi:hypothetical protein